MKWKPYLDLDLEQKGNEWFGFSSPIANIKAISWAACKTDAWQHHLGSEHTYLSGVAGFS